MRTTNSKLSGCALFRAGVCTLGLFAAAGLVGCAGGGGTVNPKDVKGRYIVVVCDADMTPMAFGARDLGPRAPEAKDSLTVIALPIQEPSTPFGRTEVSNSALGPPSCVAVSKDGRWAYVVESRGPAGPNARTVDDLPVGQNLSIVDMTDPLRPSVRGKVYVGEGPTAVAVHPDGDLVAVVTRSERQQLVVVAVKDGDQVGDPVAWPLLGLDDDSAVPSCVAWQPGRHDGSGEVLAVTLPERNQVMFYRFKRETDGSMVVAPFGAPVTVGKFPYSGAFTPDGKYFITTDLQWGKDVEGFSVGAGAGQLTVIRVGEPGPENGQGMDTTVSHAVVSTATVGVSPEGLAISPDGNLVVTSNILRSQLPDSDNRQTKGGSLSLLTFDRSSGQLTPAGEYQINAMPGGITFDQSGRYLVVTQFRSFDPDATDGELAFWRVSDGRNPSLREADFFVGVGAGPHGVLIVR